MTAPARQLTGLLLLVVCVAVTGWWALGDHRLPDLPAIHQPPATAPVVSRPLGPLEGWARASAAAFSEQVPAQVTYQGSTTKVTRVGAGGVLCPAATGGCLSLSPTDHRIAVAWGARARAALTATLRRQAR